MMLHMALEQKRNEYPLQFIYKLFYFIFKTILHKYPKKAGDFSLIDRKVVDKLIQLPRNLKLSFGK